MEESLALVLQPAAPKRVNPALIVWLPDIEPLQLFRLAEIQPDVENHPSADLRTCRTYLTWKSPEAQLEVRLDTWDLSAYVATIEHGFVVVFVGPGQAVAAMHRMDAETVAALCCDIQAASSATGPNWKPWRIYSEEEMAAAEGRVDLPSPETFIPRVAALTLRT